MRAPHAAGVRDDQGVELARRRDLGDACRAKGRSPVSVRAIPIVTQVAVGGEVLARDPARVGDPLACSANGGSAVGAGK